MLVALDSLGPHISQTSRGRRKHATRPALAGSRPEGFLLELRSPSPRPTPARRLSLHGDSARRGGINAKHPVPRSGAGAARSGPRTRCCDDAGQQQRQRSGAPGDGLTDWLPGLGDPVWRRGPDATPTPTTGSGLRLSIHVALQPALPATAHECTASTHSYPGRRPESPDSSSTTTQLRRPDSDVSGNPTRTGPATRPGRLR